MIVKICGITNLEDALAAVDAGAAALGFNFYPPSPRYIEPRLARDIIEQLQAVIPLPVGGVRGGTKLLTVGVFVNESPRAIEELALEAGVAALQLHGDESPENCRALKDRFVIKALAVKDDFDPLSAREYPVEAIMLDAFSRKLRGGTGQTIDWSIARRTRELVPKLFLAGGLSPENVAEAIRAVEPFAVDACSALEVQPGKKDHDRVRAFVKAAMEV